jgi:hypothetical protein
MESGGRYSFYAPPLMETILTVSGLAMSITRKGLFTRFKRYGYILEINLHSSVRDNAKIGFIYYDNAESVQRARSENVSTNQMFI